MAEPEAILALDLSLTSTGWAAYDGIGTIGSKLRGLDRLVALRDQVLRLAGPTIDLVVIEGYSYGSKFSQPHSLGELGGVVRVSLHEHGMTVIDVPPKCLKKYATGSGNASKELVLTEAVRRLGYQGSSNDEADALWLYSMACDALCGIPAMVPKDHRAGLNGVEWSVAA